MPKLILFLAVILLLRIPTAHAYIGPGVGAGMLAVVMGILSSIFFALVGTVWYPIKRLIKRRRSRLSDIDESRTSHPPSDTN